ncbi:MAG: cobalamin B12-binding domain-containing protein [Gemmatimonadaceae bacterium]|nr:cobalamin B12-binding domain-containing protein [Gemmatimonadaceae bacterium]
MELELIPRLLNHARAHGTPDWPVRKAVPIGPDDVTAFVQASLSHDEEACPAIVSALIDTGASLERICLDLLAPAARILGVRWEEDEADFLEVTLGLGRMQRVVRDLGRRVAAETPMSADAGQALLCGMPDEQHSLGLAMVAEFFVADGWGVTVGPPLGAEDILHELGAHWYDVLGLSVGVNERVPRVAELIRTVRATSLNADLAIMVGGRAFVDNPALVTQVGADASAADAAQGPLVARTLVQSRRASAALDTASPPLSDAAQ